MQTAEGQLDLAVEALEALDRWLAREVPDLGRLLSVERFGLGRSNPTYKLICESGACVLRRKPFGALLPKAHLIEREYAVLSALGGAAPVPRTLAYCEDAGVIGAPFFLMEFLGGRVFTDAALPGLDPAERGGVYEAMNAAAAALHSLRPEVLGLAGYGRPEGFMARQVGRWEQQYRAAATRPTPCMEALGAWLVDHVPAHPGRDGIFHGDLGLHNLMFHPDRPQVIGILDWELSTLGDLDADFAYNMAIWRLPAAAPFNGLRGLDLDALGIPREAAYREAYFARAGRDPPADWPFYQAFNFFRMAAIMQGIARRAELGNAASADAAVVGAHVDDVAEIGWAIALGRA